MLTRLSFIIYGNKSQVTRRANEFMLAMGRTMGKDIGGTTLVELGREDLKENLRQLKRRQLNSAFPELRKKFYGTKKQH